MAPCQNIAASAVGGVESRRPGTPQAHLLQQSIGFVHCVQSAISPLWLAASLSVKLCRNQPCPFEHPSFQSFCSIEIQMITRVSTPAQINN